MGFGVNDDETYANLLQAKLDVPVYNLGVESYATEREIRRLFDLGLADKVHTIIIHYHKNDLEENQVTSMNYDYFAQFEQWNNLRTTVPSPQGLKGVVYDIKEKFIFAINLFPRFVILTLKKEQKPWDNWSIFNDDFSPHRNALLKALNEYNDNLRTKKVIIINSNEWGKVFKNYKTGYDKDYNHIYFLDINLKRDDHYFIDDHPNLAGHKKIADQIYKFLLNN